LVRRKVSEFARLICRVNGSGLPAGENVKKTRKLKRESMPG